MKNTVLIAFLGRSPKGEEGYRKTRYDFGDNSLTEETAFFGWVLRKRIDPDHLVILGTRGSMWDHLFEGDLDLGEMGEQDRMALMEHVESHSVSQDQLDKMAPLLAKALGIPVRLRSIPYCSTEAEQIELLRIIAEEVEPEDRVHLDISHGFRHLPMLALLSALHVRQIRDANVEGIWYGSYDPDTGKAPVYELSGLLRIADWLQSLASFDKDGDYRVFVPLLRQANLDPEACD
ncbi:MAG: TIGR02221 family CRISPR-associated protein, partial [Deltaproteobacteria bacterium]